MAEDPEAPMDRRLSNGGIDLPQKMAQAGSQARRLSGTLATLMDDVWVKDKEAEEEAEAEEEEKFAEIRGPAARNKIRISGFSEVSGVGGAAGNPVRRVLTRGESGLTISSEMHGAESSWTVSGLMSTKSTKSTASALLLPENLGRRGLVNRMLSSHNFDLLMGITIVSNVGLMIYETDKNAPCAQDPDTTACTSRTVVLLNNIFLAIYTIEVLLRFFALRFRIIYSTWNILDITVVVTGYIDVVLGEVLPSMSLLRIFRVFRLLRAVRIFQKIPELHAMLRGFLSAMYAMFWGLTMVIIVMLLFSVLCVELIHPVSLRVHEDNLYCREAFGTVWYCMLMMFQTLVAGDSWGDCYIPIIKDQWWSFSIFALALVCVQLGFMNLILAVIVERASRAKEDDDEEIRKEKNKNERKATHRLRKLFASIDPEHSGTISLQALMQGFDTNVEFSNLFGRLDMSRNDVALLFELMDADDAGELSYDYLIENLRSNLQDNTRMNLRMLRLQAAEIARCVKKVHNKHKPAFVANSTNRLSYMDKFRSDNFGPTSSFASGAGSGNLRNSMQSLKSSRSVNFEEAPSESSVAEPELAESPPVKPQVPELGKISAYSTDGMASATFVGSSSRVSMQMEPQGSTPPKGNRTNSKDNNDRRFIFDQEIVALRILLDKQLTAIQYSMGELNETLARACPPHSPYSSQNSPYGSRQVSDNNETQQMNNQMNPTTQVHDPGRLRNGPSPGQSLSPPRPPAVGYQEGVSDRTNDELNLPPENFRSSPETIEKDIHCL